MKRTTAPLLAFALFCIIIGCSSDQSNPVLPTDSSVSTKFSDASTDAEVSWNGTLMTDPCDDELLTCTGSMKFRYHVVLNRPDRWHITSHMTSESFVATNERTGTTYKVNESSTYSAEVRPPYPIVSTQTIKVSMKGSDGSRFQFHYHLHITLDKNGDIRLTDSDATQVCD